MYYNELWKLFPWKVAADKIRIAILVRALVNPLRTDVAEGSSFCVVSGVITPGRIPLYLSEVSYKHLVELGLVTESDLHRTRGE